MDKDKDIEPVDLQLHHPQEASPIQEQGTEPDQESASSASTLPTELWHLILLHLLTQDAWLSLRPVNRLLHSLVTRHFRQTVLPRLRVSYSIYTSEEARRRGLYPPMLLFRHASLLSERGKALAADDQGGGGEQARFILDHVVPAWREAAARRCWPARREEIKSLLVQARVGAEDVQGQSGGGGGRLPAQAAGATVMWSVAVEGSELTAAIVMPLPGLSVWVEAEGVEAVSCRWKEAVGVWCRELRAGRSGKPHLYRRPVIA
ncbi:hypothetical protein K431DRAFT_88491 [Polychaeton citri CBS 116435]|uniref:F-box domain-containing protein n=1 Tax=Polychaeton citri CBS 116435 TaxID=1314669 RepID=A0A9P4Q4X3_9PEZI|nr:hypothetical protein K431DRAFT_88491 [Polychaeton citri CBS 116435]